MKIIFIFLFTMAGMLVINFSLDLLVDDNFFYALQDLWNPFWVMEPIGYLIMALLLMITLISPLKPYFKKKKAKPNQ